MNAADFRVRAEQIQILARNLPFTTVTGVAIALLAAGGAAATVGGWIWNWAIAFAAVAALRLAMLPFYWKALGRDGHHRFWGWALTLNTLASGLMWLAYGLLTFVPNDATHALFVAIIQTGLTAASLASLSAFIPAMLAFAIPTMAGFIIPCALSGERTLTVLSVMACVFMLVIFLASRRAEKVLVQSIRLRYDNQRLIEDLQRAKSEAEAASRAKSDFLAVMSHEIRTPINGVAAMAELLGQTSTDSEQGSMVSILRQSADSLLAIIDDILDFSKIEAGRLLMEDVPFELARVVEDAAQMVAPRAFEKGLELVVDLEPDLPARIHGDPVRLRQVLLNLAGNAVKFTERGHVRLSARARGDQLLFAVEDTGIGIAPEYQASLFQPFTQADGSVARRYGGSGLGLSICKRLLELMGGRIWLESRQGHGTRFFFLLPARPEMGAAIVQPLIGLTVSVVAQPPLRPALERMLVAQGAMVIDHGADVVVRDGPGLGTETGPVVELVPFHHLTSGSATGLRLRKPVRGDDLAQAIQVALGRVPAQAQSVPPGQRAYRAPDGATADAEGARILVAEDSPTNRMVISKMLNRLGLVYDLAKDGAEALTMFRAGAYGLVLTDFHMPEMDGLTLARIIRSGEVGADTPIIALTADVLPETAARCAQVGMQGYLTKPVSLLVLEKAIGEYLPRALQLRQEVTPEPAQAVVPHRPASHILDSDLLSEIFGALDAEALALLSDYRATTAARLDSLSAAVAAGNAEEAKRHAHTARGTSSSVGANALADCFGVVEDAVVAGNFSEARHALEQTAVQLETFTQFLAGLKAGEGQ